MNTDPPTPPAHSPGTNDDELIPLAVVPHPLTGHLLCSVLESLGVKGVVLGEHAATNTTFFSAVGTTQVHIRRGDYDKAVVGLAEFMQQANELGSSEDQPTMPKRCLACGYDMQGLAANECCPECGTAWSALAKLRNTIALCPPPAMRGASDEAVKRMGAMGGTIIMILLVSAIVVTTAWMFWTLLSR